MPTHIRRIVFKGYASGVEPKLLQGVVVTALLAEYMNHDIPIIHKHPSRTARIALNMVRPDLDLTQSTRDVVGNGLNLGMTVAVTDNEHVGQDGLLAHVQKHNLSGLLVRGCTGCRKGFLDGV